MASFSYTNRTNFLAAGLADTIVGNSGADSLIFSATVALIDADFAAPRLNAARVDATTKVERLHLFASAASQVVLGPNAESFGIASVFGGSGADSLDLSAYSTGVTISGGSGNDTILGGAGNDSIDGNSGDDSMVGGLGDDYYIVSSSLDNILENFGEGTDTIQAGATYTLSGNVEVGTLSGTTAIHIFGNNLSNSLFGNNTGANSIDGGTGADTMIGGSGNDTYFVDDAGDVVSELASGGTDWVVSTLNAYTLADQVEKLLLSGSVITATGNSLANSIVGNAEDNSLVGGDGADTLLGSSGNDSLDGGDGADSMTGGDGDDYYLVDNTGDRITEASLAGGTDTILVSVSGFNMASAANHVENAVLAGLFTSLSGNSIANSLVGNAAANSLSGVAGNDTLIGFAGNDTLNGGADADSMVGGLDNDYYLVDNLSDSILELSSQGTDSVVASVEGYILPDHVEFLSLAGGAFISGTGNSLVNTIVGNSSSNSLFAGDGNDSIDGGTGTVSDTIYGGAGNDTLNGNAGNDSLIGEAGNDYYLVGSLTDIILEIDGEGTDTVSVSINSYNMGTSANHVENAILTGTIANLTGNSIANSLTGNASPNSLNGGAGNDTLVGGVGNDTLNGSTDADSMAGGANDDYYFVDNASDVVLEALSEGTDTVSISTLPAYTLGNNVERLILLTDTTTGTGNSLTNRLIGNSLANTLSGLDGADSLAGGNGDDSLSGGASNDTLLGEAGADTLDGGSGVDRMLGGAGNDYYIVDSATDAVVELLGEGTDSVLANINSYTLANSVEALILGSASTVISGTGNAGANTLWGNSNNNSLNGGAGADTLIGGVGNDYYTVDLTTDVVIENSGEGTDSVLANITGVTLSDHVEILVLGGTVLAGTGNSTDNTLIGNASANSLSGGAGNDSLYGGSGTVADTLVGGDGQDTLNGGDGNDSMDGGGGNDTYLVNSTSDIIVEADSAGTDSVIASVTGYTLAGNTEVLVLSGTVIYGMGNSLSNTLVGNSAANSLNGGSGVDTLIGGTGNDTYILDTVFDKVIEYDSEGTELVVGNFASSYTLAEYVENLQLVTGSYATGNSLNNSMTGNAAANTLDGGAGDDTLVGGAGADFYIVDQVGDTIVESGADTDTVLANNENHTLGASVENLILGTGILAGSGNSLANSITGNSIANSLAGDSSDDTLMGLADDDTLNGGTGNDSMVGGLGNDLYLLDSLSDTILESLSQGIDSVLASVSGYTLAAHVDYLELTGVVAAGTGNSLSNTLVGNAANNSLDGGGGIDSMAGGTGNDTYFVDNLSDLVDELSPAGTDLVVATVSGYTLAENVEALLLAGSVAVGTGNGSANTLTGNASNNTLDGGEGADTLIGGLGNDYYVVDNIADVLVENVSEGTDSVLSNLATYTLATHFEHLILGTGLSGTGNSGGNSLIGNTDDNTLDGGTGSDTLAGGVGNDYYTIDDLTDRVVEASASGEDQVLSNINNYVLTAHVESLTLGVSVYNGTGNSLDNSLTGNALANSLSGAAGNDTFSAGADNDTLNGGIGDDSMAGGTGDDLYLVDSVLDQVIEDSSAGTDSVLATVEDYTLAANLEHLELATGVMIGSGNSIANTLLGNAASNSLDGGDGNDTLFGLGANDTLNGGLGDDSLIGGSGDDFYEVDSISDTILELAAGGTDTVLANLSTYTIANQIENLILGVGGISGIGSNGANSIQGNASNNSLDGGAGIDTLVGAGGHDTYFVSDSGDLVIENGDEGTDIVISSLSGYTLTNDVEGLVLTGSATLGSGNAGNNTLMGHSTLANSLSGVGGDDTLIGGSGNDTLDGGADADSLDGGLGNDYYIVDNVGDVISDSGGTDTILVNVSGGFTLAGGSVIENLILGTGNQITGNASNNSMVGNASNNSLDGGGGTDTLIGAAGDDYYTVDSLDDVIIEESNGGNDSVVANFNGYILGANIENVILADGVASISGGSTANYLVGNSIDNTLDGGGGADTLVGLDSNDYYVVDHLADVIIETSGVSSGTDSVLANISVHTLSSNVEYLLLGSLGVAGIGNSLANTIVGNSKSNSLDGGDGSDSLLGGGGNDTLNGGLGNDTMVGGVGNDYFVVDSASDSLVGGGGNDGIITLMDGYTLSTDFNLMVLGGSVATASGNSNNNTITGNTFSNTLHGGGGEDSLVGRTGHDYYLVDSSSDVVLELASEGTDTVEFSSISDYTLGNNVERLMLGAGAVNGTGNSLVNILTGNAGANSLSGAAGNDSLHGGDGDDTLLGALATSSGGYAEIDTLTGGNGSDIFVLGTAAGYLYSDAKSNSIGITDYAYITDFTSGSDKLQLVGSAADYYLGAHSVSGLTAHQGLFRELGTTDELIAILQGSPIATLDNSTVNWV
ncbi:MAG: hypothetical protein CAK90_08505 [Spartobacteria bacterium AMD-G4]|nr:MAG: hypothetical protein CAK90_08505 [Spartobacteria bacterium AMD-G4]